MVRRGLFIGAIVMALLAPTAVLAGERDGSAAGDDRGGTHEAATDQRGDDARGDDAVVIDSERDQDVDRRVDRAPDVETDRAADRERDRVTDKRPVRCDRVTDRITDCRRHHEPPDDRPTWRQILKRCLWHHVGDRPIWEGMTPREIRHLLHRCLWHHHHGPPV